jgi:hypothetical protein
MKWENRDIKKQEIKDTKRLIQGTGAMKFLA